MSTRTAAVQTVGVLTSPMGPVGTLLTGLAGKLLLKPKHVPYDQATDPKQLGAKDAMLYEYDRAKQQMELDYERRTTEMTQARQAQQLENERRGAAAMLARVESNAEAQARLIQEEQAEAAAKLARQAQDRQAILRQSTIAGSYQNVDTTPQFVEALETYRRPAAMAPVKSIVYDTPSVEPESKIKYIGPIVAGFLVISLIVTGRTKS